MKITWKQSPLPASNREDSFVGPFCVGCVYFDASRRRDDPLAWSTGFYLPSREGKSWKKKSFATPDVAKFYVETLIKNWFQEVREE